MNAVLFALSLTNQSLIRKLQAVVKPDYDNTLIRVLIQRGGGTGPLNPRQPVCFHSYLNLFFLNKK